MPKKFCIHFDGDSCTSNYHTSTEKVSVFRFPKPIKERTKCIGSLPTIVEVNDETVIYEKHWPKDFKVLWDINRFFLQANLVLLQLVAYHKHPVLSREM